MRSRQRPVTAMACVLALLSVFATSCGVYGGGISRTGSVGADGSKSWNEGGWQDWDSSKWLRDAADFVNPVIDGLWKPDRMREGVSTDQPVPGGIGDQGISDPEPAAVFAEPVPVAYRDSAPVVGKLFFDTPEGPSVCSATAVADPARPGASDLVWTAGHCVHAGAKGGWFRNIVFVPSYNDEGLTSVARQDATKDQLSPFGIWWADWAQTSPEWIEQGSSTGGKGSPYDFAVLHVKPPAGSDFTTLEATVGGAAAIDFGVESAARIKTVGIWGYPADTPFDGELMFTCEGRPGRLSIRADQPSLYRIGCTMTGGSSGGGWFVQDSNGLPVLVSNTSIGPTAQTWLAGPRLGEGARTIYDAVSGKFA
ncbi:MULTISPECIES: trypsin-like serine peptidase [unclassified Streptomyces]|uniref:trypsin-like serine peptidase n=1 Tax=unclassified Streptomyces TaxID=2593676 RepID=UPI00382ED222